MADETIVGLEEAAFEFPLERGKIREFAIATKSKNPDYLEDPEPPIEPTFLTTAQFWAPPGEPLVKRAGLDLRRVLHGGQEYVFHGPPPRAGTTLSAVGRIAEVYEKEGKRGGTMTFVVAVQEFRDPSGRLVAESRATVIETARPPADGAA